MKIEPSEVLILIDRAKRAQKKNTTIGISENQISIIKKVVWPTLKLYDAKITLSDIIRVLIEISLPVLVDFSNQEHPPLGADPLIIPELQRLRDITDVVELTEKELLEDPLRDLRKDILL